MIIPAFHFEELMMTFGCQFVCFYGDCNQGWLQPGVPVAVGSMISHFSGTPIRWRLTVDSEIWWVCWGYADFLLSLMRVKKKSLPMRWIPR